MPRVRGLARVCQIGYHTRTHGTRLSGTAGLPVPVLNASCRKLQGTTDTELEKITKKGNYSPTIQPQVTVKAVTDLRISHYTQIDCWRLSP